MAKTVKLNAGKVILKNNAVSCTCCDVVPEACCMYPANGLGVIYEAEDLPEKIWMGPYDEWPSDPPYAVLVSRDGTIYGPHTEPASGDTHRVAHVSTGLWQRQLAAGGWGNLDSDDCLFFSPSQDFSYDLGGGLGFVRGFGVGLIWDNYLDTYEATCTTTSFGGSVTITNRTFVRESLCVWRSRNAQGQIDGQLYYRSLASEQEAIDIGKGRILWALSGTFRSDAGPYNSPAGTYGGCVVAGAE